MAIDEDGHLWTWGDGAQGRLGHGDTGQQNVPKEVQYFTRRRIKVIQCRGGSTHSAVITDQGHLYMWGNGTDYQLGSSNAQQQSTPTKVTSLKESVATVMLGDKYTMVIPGRPLPNLRSLSVSLVNRNSMIGLERRRSSLFGSTPDLSALMSGSRKQLEITFEDRLEREEYQIGIEEQADHKQSGDKLEKYLTMKSLGMPPQAIINKMRLDGLTDDDIECFKNSSVPSNHRYTYTLSLCLFLWISGLIRCFFRL